MPTLEFCTQIDAPAAEVFAWHARPGAFERLTPPWDDVRLVERSGGIEDGRLVLLMPLGPFRLRWVAQHRDFIPGLQFRDVQVQGPFARWEHTHRIEPEDRNSCTLVDRIDYDLPLGRMGAWLGGPAVARKIRLAFAHRHRITHDDIARHSAARATRPMHIAITGSTGLVGSALADFLTAGGHRVVRLVRGAGAPRHAAQDHVATEQVRWDPAAGTIDAAALEGLDAVVHLGGAGIADGRLDAAHLARVRDSRVDGTALLARALASMRHPPRALIVASAVGYYGDRGEEKLTEASPPGNRGLLAPICLEWENAADPARRAGLRVAHLRLGVVLSPRGGALAKMLTPFKLGLGGVIGPGTQYWSWISLDDAVGAFHHALTRDDLAGPVNAVSPHPVTNREFTRALGRVLRRPTILPLPGFVARLALGAAADELLLASARVVPARLLADGFQFRDPGLEPALARMLGRDTPEETASDAHPATLHTRP
ncbi:MAG: TIGR01777 family oxidoreductase [Planctomycetota bacterium]|nr:TIGR01777 family oxidoreductase [Planctomycetota bacterium]